MRYKTRPGVVLASVCGQELLVAAEAARAVCPALTEINETSAFLWRRLEEGSNVGDLEAAVAEEYEVEDTALVRGAICDFLDQMMKLNYLLTDEQGGPHEE